MDFEKAKKAVIVASIFHDIGKFWQRAVRGNEGLSHSTLALESELCPEFGKYRHVLWTSEFFESFEKFFPIDVSEKLTDEALDNVKNLSARHHKPSTPLHYIIQQADWLSSGMDRVKTADAQDEEIGAFREKKLISIFSYDMSGNGKNWVYNLTTLKPTDDVFPFEEKERVDLTGEYARLWVQFIEDFKNASVLGKHFNIWVGSILSILERYTWCIPSSTKDVPDVSLYDHLKTTSAIALALFCYHHATHSLNSIDNIKDKKAKKFLFIVGDLSGIQDFIYSLSITNVKGASKILRARSFYLQAIVEMGVYYILNALGLSPVSVIMNAGGRFIILAPNLDTVKEKLKEIERRISKWLFDEFNGKISLNITYDVEVSGEDLMQDKFRNVLQEIQLSAERKKRRKFFELFGEGHNGFVLDKLYNELRRNGHCQICDENPGVKSLVDETGEAIKICRQCDTFLNLGRWLIESEAVSYTTGKIPGVNKSVEVFEGLHFNLHKLHEINVTEDYYYIELFKIEEGFLYPVKFLANYVPVWRMEEEEIFNHVREIEQTFDKAANRVKTFGEIAEVGLVERRNGEITKEGKAMLGILKADVDNLGSIFSSELGEEFAKHLSISKYVTLSRNMDFYFAGYLNHLLEEKYKNVYVVYSGGDDLVLVGEWKDIIEVAEKIYKKFREFTTWNRGITLSAGIALIGPRYPINRGILMADEFLEKSKGSEGKDSLTIFNTTVKWKLLPKLWEWRSYFEKWLTSTESKVKTTFMHRLLTYQRMAKDYYETKNPNGLRFTYLLKYDVARNIVERKGGRIVKGEEEMRKLFELVENNLKEEYKELWLALHIPIFYVLYKYRGKKLKGGQNG